ncbi:hypothetical protein WS70_23795 [Burkholderia mayonis]|uniref:Uncharacterized protein n=1 Tax=Burkholderia mayonis TaxID=1385591 RepID=A0A1B4FM96_9BURK|nr:hypothetical protein WS70_23795 [Burkholderia mayonis]KVE36786.1 hypothetical protein WS69_11445 [Burkholderia sp. BDU5]KVE41325.1 hypothetical protein WS70_15015 [Burkholderia mayonis]
MHSKDAAPCFGRHRSDCKGMRRRRSSYRSAKPPDIARADSEHRGRNARRYDRRRQPDSRSTAANHAIGFPERR